MYICIPKCICNMYLCIPGQLIMCTCMVSSLTQFYSRGIHAPRLCCWLYGKAFHLLLLSTAFLVWTWFQLVFHTRSPASHRCHVSVFVWNTFQHLLINYPHCFSGACFSILDSLLGFRPGIFHACNMDRVCAGYFSYCRDKVLNRVRGRKDGFEFHSAVRHGGRSLRRLLHGVHSQEAERGGCCCSVLFFLLRL